MIVIPLELTERQRSIIAQALGKAASEYQKDASQTELASEMIRLRLIINQAQSQSKEERFSQVHL